MRISLHGLDELVAKKLRERLRKSWRRIAMDTHYAIQLTLDKWVETFTFIDEAKVKQGVAEHLHAK
jgi:aryl carrier-like protein